MEREATPIKVNQQEFDDLKEEVRRLNVDNFVLEAKIKELNISLNIQKEHNSFLMYKTQINEQTIDHMQKLIF